MGKLTSFYDRESGQAGPVDGAIVPIIIPVDLAAGSGTYTYTVDLPAGMSIELTDGTFRADGITATPELTVGDTAAGTQVVAAVTCTANLGALTIVDGTIDAGGIISVVFSATASDAIANGVLTLVGHVAAAPDSIDER
jgi:hypothetical protein